MYACIVGLYLIAYHKKSQTRFNCHDCESPHSEKKENQSLFCFIQNENTFLWSSCVHSMVELYACTCNIGWLKQLNSTDLITVDRIRLPVWLGAIFIDICKFILVITVHAPSGAVNHIQVYICTPKTTQKAHRYNSFKIYLIYKCFCIQVNLPKVSSSCSCIQPFMSFYNTNGVKVNSLHFVLWIAQASTWSSESETKIGFLVLITNSQHLLCSKKAFCSCLDRFGCKWNTKWVKITKYLENHFVETPTHRICGQGKPPYLSMRRLYMLSCYEYINETIY
jgi:hypothetical protein